MDTGLARTFLEIVRSGSFIAAAQRLHITQAAVTARIRALETQLGCTLLVRNRAGAKLTADGEVFAVHANQMVQAWDAARRDLPLAAGQRNILHFGGEASMGNTIILDWIRLLRRDLPHCSIRADIGRTAELLMRVAQGSLDAALVYQPEYIPGLQVEGLLEEKLIQVCLPSRPAPYVYIDWGEEFRRQHDQAFPERRNASLSFNLGPLGLQHILESGGSGYFRARIVQSYLDAGLLERVPMTPEFSFPVYLVYSRERESDLLAAAFGLLRQVAAGSQDCSQRWDPLI